MESAETPPIKVVIAKPGLDGHDRGAKVVARALRDAGMEVVYTGIFQTPESILRAVIQEDAAVLGLNSYSDGLNVVIAARAKGFEQQLREAGYRPIGVDLSELLLGGGGVKCCTLELRR